MSRVIPIEALNTFEQGAAREMGRTTDHPTAYARARARYERRCAMAAWTPQEDAMLRNFAHEGEAACAERLGRTTSAVMNRAHRLGVSLVKREVGEAWDESPAPAEPVAPPECVSADCSEPRMPGSAFCPEHDAEVRAETGTRPINALATIETLDAAARQLLGPNASISISNDLAPLPDLLTPAEHMRDLADDLEKARIQLLSYALRDAFSITFDEAEAFLSAHVIPLVEIAERAGEAHAELEASQA